MELLGPGNDSGQEGDGLLEHVIVSASRPTQVIFMTA